MNEFQTPISHTPTRDALGFSCLGIYIHQQKPQGCEPWDSLHIGGDFFISEYRAIDTAK